MRTNWLLGLVLGIFIGGFALEAGVLALLLAVPALVWALRGRTWAAALSGLFVGAGASCAGLIGLAQMQCVNVSGRNFGSFCTPPDLTPYLVVAAVLIAIGAAVGFLGIRGSIRGQT